MERFFKHYLRLYRPIVTVLNKLLGQHGLSYSLWQVMVYVHEREASTLVDISNYYGVEKPSITRRVQRLEELGLIASEPGQDRREKRITLTPQGLEICRTCRRDITALEKRIMAGLSEHEQRTLAELLPRLQTTILNLESRRDD